MVQDIMPAAIDQRRQWIGTAFPLGHHPIPRSDHGALIELGGHLLRKQNKRWLCRSAAYP